MRRAQPSLLAALVGVLALCWILLTPPGAGPDEHSHLVRAGALANGDWDELLARTLTGEFAAHDLPQEYSIPEPACYAQQPRVPVDCAAGTDVRPVGPDGNVTLLTTADNYPIWGHVVPALGTALPGDGGIWAARIASAAVAVALVSSALVAARRWEFGPAGVLVALTPMAWSTFGTVNPSVFATAGAVAVWVALAGRRPGWMLAAGWAALVLPRRDGLIWACLTLGAVVVLCGRDVLTDAWQERRRLAGPLALIAASTLMTLVWDVTNGSRVAQLGALAPGIVAAAWGARWCWDRWAERPTRRAALVLGGAVAGGFGLVASFVARPGGWNGQLTRDVIGETRRHLTEAIGVLGWLDTPLPRWSAAAWVGLVAALVVIAVRARAWTALRLAGAALGLAVVTSWVFELQEGSGYGRYWQGRYSLPLLAGVPIALALHRRADRLNADDRAADERAAGRHAAAGHLAEPPTRPATEPGHHTAAGHLAEPPTRPATEPGHRAAAGHLAESPTRPATEPGRHTAAGGAAWIVAAVALGLLNVAAWAAARRWAVGINGTYRPWKWGAELLPVHPLPVLAVHAAASVLLALTLSESGSRPAPS